MQGPGLHPRGTESEVSKKMARFPKKETEITALADVLWIALWQNQAIFPVPPVHPAHIRGLLTRHQRSRIDFLAKRAAAEAATTEKDEALIDLTEAVKVDIRYAENTVNYDDDKLKLIGWAGKKASAPLEQPGQVRLLEATKQGEGWVFLDWKVPTDGGKPRAYKIQRRLRNNGNWQDVATAILTEATLVEQPEKTELEYRLIAVNKAGEGQPSNTVNVVL